MSDAYTTECRMPFIIVMVFQEATKLEKTIKYLQISATDAGL